uniref:Uncharacterized protein n=1 Tax=Timema monikensis TaxID=170555 RepID=A0A7R9EC13_9NEOP|nr:unnamed protein product [Timema monikensis]
MESQWENIYNKTPGFKHGPVCNRRTSVDEIDTFVRVPTITDSHFSPGITFPSAAIPVMTYVTSCLPLGPLLPPACLCYLLLASVTSCVLVPDHVREFSCGKMYYRTFYLDERRDVLYVGAMSEGEGGGVARRSRILYNSRTGSKEALRSLSLVLLCHLDWMQLLRPPIAVRCLCLVSCRAVRCLVLELCLVSSRAVRCLVLELCLVSSRAVRCLCLVSSRAVRCLVLELCLVSSRAVSLCAHLIAMCLNVSVVRVSMSLWYVSQCLCGTCLNVSVARVSMSRD